MSNAPIGFTNELMIELEERGFIHSVTAAGKVFDLDRALEKPCVIYCGFDCTAPSLHIGSLIPLRMMKMFMDAGHKVVPVIGLATTKIGDPSGRDDARPILTEAEIEKNANGIEKSISAMLGDIHCSPSAMGTATAIRNNIFFDDLNVIDFMRDVGQHISISDMMRLSSVRSRLETQTGMTFLEFSYSLFQARDFERIVNMFPNHTVIQIGGSDQWGNITMGLELAKKTWRFTAPINDPFGITTPLLTTSDGKKMGKTANGAVWLNDDMLSHFDFWQFWRNVADDDLERFMKLFSESDLDMIDVTMHNEAMDMDIGAINIVKKAFAMEVTSMVRGDDAAREAFAIAEDMFETKTNDKIPHLIVELTDDDVPLAKIMKEQGLVNSIGAGNRLIAQNGVRIDDEKLDDSNGAVTIKKHVKTFKLSIGKKQHYMITVC